MNKKLGPTIVVLAPLVAMFAAQFIFQKPHRVGNWENTLSYLVCLLSLIVAFVGSITLATARKSPAWLFITLAVPLVAIACVWITFQRFSPGH
jgi:hypothetical protein